MANPRRRRVNDTRRSQSAYRSQFEAGVARALTDAGVAFKYESMTYPIKVPATRGHRCKCGSSEILRTTRYTPDFAVNEIVVETKGKFTGRDRRIALAFRAQYPDVDYRLLFQRDNTLSKLSDTRYSEWCSKNSFPYSVGPTIPKDWLT